MIHLLDSGHSSLLFLGQLHMLRPLVLEIVDNVDLLCPSIVCFTLSTISSTSGLNMCSCPKNNKELCPLSNKCITESVVYQATVTIKDKTTNRPPQGKHMSDLQKTRSKQDLQTIKHHSTLSTNGTLPN